MKTRVNLMQRELADEAQAQFWDLRSQAAAAFNPGDRVAHATTGMVGTNVGQVDGIGIAEMWVRWDETPEKLESTQPCNPLDLQLLPATIPVAEGLNYDEEADRLRLERSVEQALVLAGKALKELRDRRLYRSTHSNFEEYCQARFGYVRRTINLKIAAAEVFENLEQSGCQLPKYETQLRSLSQLDAAEQPEVWNRALSKAAGLGKQPTAAAVEQEVRLHQHSQPTSPQFVAGALVQIHPRRGSELRRFDGYWAIVEAINPHSYSLRVATVKELQLAFEEELMEVDQIYTVDIMAVSERIAYLVNNFEVRPVHYEVLNWFQRSQIFEPIDLDMLVAIETAYGVATRAE